MYVVESPMDKCVTRVVKESRLSLFDFWSKDPAGKTVNLTISATQYPTGGVLVRSPSFPTCALPAPSRGSCLVQHWLVLAWGNQLNLVWNQLHLQKAPWNMWEWIHRQLCRALVRLVSSRSTCANL